MYKELKKLVEALKSFDILVKKGCTCSLHAVFHPSSSEIIYNEDCPIHTREWRWDYLAWEGELPA